MKPHVICHMMSSLDGSLAVGHWSDSPGISREDRGNAYEEVHRALDAQGWLVGRVTMAEMTDAVPHPPEGNDVAERPHHFARREAEAYAIALDPSGKLHFDEAEVNGDHVVVLLGAEVPDSHLRELAADGVSYVVADGPEMDLAAMLDTLGRELGIKRLLLEGGGGINGSFLAAGLVDEISLLVFPAVDGRSGARTVFYDGEVGLADKVSLTLTSCEMIEAGAVHLRYAVQRP